MSITHNVKFIAKLTIHLGRNIINHSVSLRNELLSLRFLWVRFILLRNQMVCNYYLSGTLLIGKLLPCLSNPQKIWQHYRRTLLLFGISAFWLMLIMVSSVHNYIFYTLKINGNNTYFVALKIEPVIFF